MEAKIDQAIINLLDDLMTKDRDAVEGYSKASANVKDLQMKEFFIGLAKKRSAFTEALKSEIDRLGGDYKDRSSVLSTVHRIWIDIKGTITGNDEDSILRECLRGEEASLEDYMQAARNEHLPKSSGKLIESHTDAIKEIITQLKERIDDEEAGDGEINPLVNDRESVMTK